MTPPRLARAGAGLVVLVLLAGCTAGLRRSVAPVAFEAPSSPDPALGPLMADVRTIGVLWTTNIEPVQGLDIEKVMGRLSDATVHRLHNLPGRTIVDQDEIRWHFRGVALDSTTVFSDSITTALRTEFNLDALVYITLRRLNAQMTPVSPSPYGTVSSPGMNLSVDLELLIVNLHTGERWSRTGRQSSWEQMQVDLVPGGRDPTERQLLAALAGPLRQFLFHLAPPPQRQVRLFDLSGD